MTALNGNGSTEKVVTVGSVLRDVSRSAVEEHLAELAKLVETAGGQVVAFILSNRPTPDAATYIGSGKAEEIRDTVKKLGATLVIFDDDLSPAQGRNLEKIIDTRVIDRSALILDIFARGARSREARTQVELAQQQYMLPRLTRAWSHLSRQAGGIGTRGVGETQLETDRRIVRERIKRLSDDLKKIEQQRSTQRKARSRVFTIALVGYTNAGKSTLFNALTRGEAVAADKLFATLDAKAHRTTATFPRETVVIDTVGFVRKLPHHLVASFRSTMEEAVSADLVLHVIDGSHQNASEQREVGNEVLKDLGIEQDHVIEVYNKADQLDGVPPFARATRNSIALSATTGEGVDALLEMIRERELRSGELVKLDIPVAESQVLARLHETSQVLETTADETALHVSAWIPQEEFYAFEAYVVEEIEPVRNAG